MKQLVEILMRRDGISEDEAWNLIGECTEELSVAIAYGDYQKCEDIFMDYLGLEPDYLDYLLL